jgi:hypothetical protein
LRQADRQIDHHRRLIGLQAYRLGKAAVPRWVFDLPARPPGRSQRPHATGGWLQEERGTAREIDRYPTIRVAAAVHRLRAGHDAAGENRLEIRGAKGHAGQSAENVFRLRAAQDALVTRQQQRSISRARHEDESGRTKWRDAFEPHRGGLRKSSEHATAKALTSRTSRQRHLRGQRPHTGTSGRDLHVDCLEVGKRKTGIGWEA